MEKTTEITPEMTAKFNLILRQVLEYVYYDVSDSERALLAIHVKTKFPNQIKECTKLLTYDYNEFFARKVFMDMMLESRYDEKFEEFVKEQMSKMDFRDLI